MLEESINNQVFEDNLPDWSIGRAYKSMSWFINQMSKYWMLWEKSPFPKLDKITSWILRGKVYTIGASSNVGKSKFAYHWVNHFLSLWKKVVFFSLEVDSWMALLNIMINKYKIPFKEFTNMENIKDLWIGDFDNLIIYDNVYQLEQINKLVHHNNPDYVFIDFVQNIQTSWWSNYEKLAKIAISIQQMAITSQATVFSLSQLSNSVWKDVSWWNLDFISLKWAWEFFASSDVIFVLYRLWDWELWMRIAKNKYWRAWEDIYFDVDFWLWQFEIKKD